MAKVVFEAIAGPIQGSAFPFDGHDVFLFGRAAECHGSASGDSSVAPHHFLVEVNPPQARLRDLGSERGTSVNGVTCGSHSAAENNPSGGQGSPGAVDLKHNDQIQAGDTVFRVLVETDPEAKTAASVKCMYCGCLVDWRKDNWGVGGRICQQCRETSQSDPLQLLRAIAPKPAGYKRGDVTPVVPGYEFDGLLGEGPSGAVYKARRSADNQQVAIKIVLPKAPVTEAQRNALLRELEGLRQVQHANIVGLIDAGPTGCGFYFVTEFCNQGNVWDLIQQHGGRLPLDIAAGILRRVLKGLAYAHENQLIHRNLKPQNILLGDLEGKLQAKIGGLGFTAAFAKAGLDGLTLTGNMDGAYAFLPREQLIRYRQASPAEDVWSTAATFYAMVTGNYPRDPLAGRDPIQTILETPVVPIRNRDAAIPKPLANVIDTALSSDDAKRYPTAVEFRTALSSAQKSLKGDD